MTGNEARERREMRDAMELQDKRKTSAKNGDVGGNLRDNLIKVRKFKHQVKY